MNVKSARQILLVKAVEQVDTRCEILNRSVRDQATAEARSQSKSRSGGKQAEAMLARRAKILCDRLELKRLSQGIDAAAWSWLAIAGAVVLWLIISGATKRFWGNEKLINILIVPLLILFIWNLIFLAATAARLVGSLLRGKPSPTLLHRFVAALAIKQESWLARFARNHGPSFGDNADTWRKALVQFGSSWTRFTQPLTAARLRFALHVAACALVAGEFAFVYLKGIAVEFEATWQSTWLTPQSTHSVLSVLLWPAHTLMKNGLPSADAIAALKVRPENAGHWINLYLAQACIVVLVPRLLLSTVEYLRVLRFERAFPLSIEGDRYYENLIHADRGQGVVARVVPYSFHPTSKTRDAIHDLLATDLGQSAHIEIDESVAYGDVKLPTDAAGSDGTATNHHVILFNLAQTPESEVHGALLASSAQTAGTTGCQFAMIVDAHAYRKRLTGEPEIDTRLASRRLAWQNLADEHGLAAYFLGMDEQQSESISWIS